MNSVRRTPSKPVKGRATFFLAPKVGPFTPLFMRSFILVELHKQIEELRARTKQLEEALAISHSSQSTSVHELLRPEATILSNKSPSSVEVDQSRLHHDFDALMISETGKMQYVHVKINA